MGRLRFKGNITVRLFFTILVATFISVVCVIMLLHYNLTQQHIQELDTLAAKARPAIIDELSRHYMAHGNWDDLQEIQNWKQFINEYIPQVPSVNEAPSTNPKPTERTADTQLPNRPPPAPSKPSETVFPDYFTLLNIDKSSIAGRGGAVSDENLSPLFHNEEIVGYLGSVPAKDLIDFRQQRVLQDTFSVLMRLSGFIVLLVGLLAFLLAKQMVRPIKRLATGTHKLAAGDFTVRVDIKTGGELGMLSDDFNHLAFTLEQNDHARNQWMAEISHELRTPVSVLRGEIEALQDEVRPLNQEALASLHAEAIHLERLADDLYQLAMVDVGTLTYRKESLNLVSLVKKARHNFKNQFAAKDIDLSFNNEIQAPLIVFGDESRLRQLCSNLLENSLKYTDPGGHSRITLSYINGRAVLDFQDSAPEVERDELEKLLDRFYRAPQHKDKPNGAGLGLSICRKIVESHQGEIALYKSPLGGLWVRVELPIRESLS